MCVSDATAAGGVVLVSIGLFTAAISMCDKSLSSHLVHKSICQSETNGRTE